MTASPLPRRPVVRPLRMVEAGPLGALFLGVVAMASLPVADWAGPWLAAAPAASLAMALALRLSRRQRPATAEARPAMVAVRRRRPAMAVAARRRGVAPRRASRLLAALALR